MNILYHMTFLPPPMPEGVAELQEVNALRRHFGGDLVYVNPNAWSPVYLPRLFFGFQKLSELRKREVNLALHHLYNPDPFAFPVLRCLRRPVVYSISGGVGVKRPRVRFFNALGAVVVSDERSFKRLVDWGIDNAFLVRAGIDTDRFSCAPLALRSEIKLLVGSAPWTKRQFQTKGVEALLLAAKQTPHLKLVFLWRGVLADEMDRRVRQMGLSQQVTVLNRLVDVNEILANVHGSIALATAPGILKAYPHSLLDSLAAGKPVLISQAIPMADYVQETGCGIVVHNVTPADILSAIASLSSKYYSLEKTARLVGRRDFSLDRFFASFRRVYEHILGQPMGSPPLEIRD